MKISKVANIIGGQDGAIYGSELFRFNTKGDCYVFDLKDIDKENVNSLEPISSFKLDKSDLVVPHSNAVCFGSDYFEKGDTYPLLYSNIYNNYNNCANAENKMIGVCLVYRIQRVNDEFRSTLVQMIEIGFCEDHELWKAFPDKHGVRPYGNFVVDNDTNSYWAFVMRNEKNGTRYFRFDLPSVHNGEIDARLNVKKVVLDKDDIREQFDCEYHRFVQGATVHQGKIYSCEGFHNDKVNRPAIRVIYLSEKEEKYYDITEHGFTNEPEFIAFCDGKCFYSDAGGNLYNVEF